MQVQFDKTKIAYLDETLSQAQTQEQIQELRIPEHMPDIGRILGCWGQIHIRSKEWRSAEIAAGGGVKAWILYLGEGEQQPKTLDIWIPFQMRWTKQTAQRDGQIRLQPYIQELECRSIGARKLMVRVNICIHARTYESAEQEVFSPEKLPPTVFVRRRTYPLELPLEAGEKPFAIDEEFMLPSGAPPVEKLVGVELLPRVREQKIAADKLIFRGDYSLRLVYLCPEGRLHSWNTEGEFSQFEELKKEYSPAAKAGLSLLINLSDTELGEQGSLRLKCALSCQYLIYDRVTVEVCDDAYSPRHRLELAFGQLQLPVLLEAQERRCHFEVQERADATQALDCFVNWRAPEVCAQADSVDITLRGTAGVLYYEDGELAALEAPIEERWQQRSDPMNRLEVDLQPGPAQVRLLPGQLQISGDIEARVCFGGAQGIPMLTAIELVQPVAPDPERPSVILRRVGSDCIWDIAKHYGSTVQAIMEANCLQGDPLPEQMLLIPVE